jgi:pSer/pThr/pTyr-binding forkhead associated (FHA) protein
MSESLIFLENKTSKIGPLNKGVNLIGRGASCCFKVHSLLCNIFHCLIKIENNVILIKDLCTLNGTFVNGVRLSEDIFTQIVFNSTIEFGRRKDDESASLWVLREIVEILDESFDSATNQIHQLNEKLQASIDENQNLITKTALLEENLQISKYNTQNLLMTNKLEEEKIQIIKIENIHLQEKIKGLEYENQKLKMQNSQMELYIICSICRDRKKINFIILQTLFL